MRNISYKLGIILKRERLTLRHIGLILLTRREEGRNTKKTLREKERWIKLIITGRKRGIVRSIVVESIVFQLKNIVLLLRESYVIFAKDLKGQKIRNFLLTIVIKQGRFVACYVVDVIRRSATSKIALNSVRI